MPALQRASVLSRIHLDLTIGAWPTLRPVVCVALPTRFENACIREFMPEYEYHIY